MKKTIYYLSYLGVYCLFSIGSDVVSKLIKAKTSSIQVEFSDLIGPCIFGFFCWILLIKIGEISSYKKDKNE